jgi:hypothetical protein
MWADSGVVFLRCQKLTEIPEQFHGSNQDIAAEFPAVYPGGT